MLGTRGGGRRRVAIKAAGDKAGLLATFVASLLLLLPPTVHAQQEARFDLSFVRPTATPQDLLLVRQSRPLGHLSLATSALLDFQLNPLYLVSRFTGQKNVNLVGLRLELDVMAAIGLFDWADVGITVPLVAYQSGDNLEVIGTEGVVAPWAMGDVTLNVKVAIPGLRREAGAAGFGAALQLALKLPTGDIDAFAGDGGLGGLVSLVGDYRWRSGVGLAANLGAALRPDSEIAGFRRGSGLYYGVAGELPVARRQGLFLIGEVTGSVEAGTAARSFYAPCNLMVALRHYATTGFVTTLSAGLASCACLPAPQLTLQLTYVFPTGRERAHLAAFLAPPDANGDDGDLDPRDDTDGDGILNRADRCPREPGPVQTRGCPDRDSDGDGLVDREDRCPREPGPKSADGCPPVRVDGGTLALAEPLRCASGHAVLLPESQAGITRIASFLAAHPELATIDVAAVAAVAAAGKAGEADDGGLAQRRAAAIRSALIARGVAPKRLRLQREPPGPATESTAPWSSSCGVALRTGAAGLPRAGLPRAGLPPSSLAEVIVQPPSPPWTLARHRQRWHSDANRSLAAERAVVKILDADLDRLRRIIKQDHPPPPALDPHLVRRLKILAAVPSRPEVELVSDFIPDGADADSVPTLAPDAIALRIREYDLALALLESRQRDLIEKVRTDHTSDMMGLQRVEAYYRAFIHARQTLREAAHNWPGRELLWYASPLGDRYSGWTIAMDAARRAALENDTVHPLLHQIEERYRILTDERGVHPALALAELGFLTATDFVGITQVIEAGLGIEALTNRALDGKERVIRGVMGTVGVASLLSAGGVPRLGRWSRELPARGRVQWLELAGGGGGPRPVILVAEGVVPLVLTEAERTALARAGVLGNAPMLMEAGGSGSLHTPPPTEPSSAVAPPTDQPVTTPPQFQVAKHGQMPSPRPGMQSHHGVMSAYMKEHYPRYNPERAPAILMPAENHASTFGVFNKWRAEMKRRMGGTFDWAKVSENEVRALSERMFDAARVPSAIRGEYWAEFERTKAALVRGAE